MKTKNLIFSIIITLFSIFSTKAQDIPKGTWKVANIMDGIVMDYKVKFDGNKVIIHRKIPNWGKDIAEKKVITGKIESTTTEELVEEEEPVEEEELVEEEKLVEDTLIIEHFEVIKVINKENDSKKGVIYLKSKNKTELPFTILIFNQVEEDILFMQPAREFESLEEAENEIEQFKKEIATSEGSVSGIKSEILKNADIYTFGFMMMLLRKEESLAKIEKMPMMQINNKEEVLKFLSNFEVQLKKVEMPENIIGPLASQLVLEKIFIQMGYNPYTSLKNIDKVMRKYNEEEDVKKANESIQKVFNEKFGYN